MRTKKLVSLFLASAMLISLAACTDGSGTGSSAPDPEPDIEIDTELEIDGAEENEPTEPEEEEEEYPEPENNTILYQGHASVRIISNAGVVIYVDPSEGKGYDAPADIILVTHEHADHNQIDLVTQNDDCTVIKAADSLVEGEYKSFSVKGVDIQAVQAHGANGHHPESSGVGYIITVDGVKIYIAGDTIQTEQMDTFAALELDYAFLPTDGHHGTLYVDEASECAELIGAKHTIPYHTKLGVLFDEDVAGEFSADSKLVLIPGEPIALDSGE